MGLLRFRCSARALRWREALSFIVLFTFQLSVAHGQEPVIFQFNEDKMWGPALGSPPATILQVPGAPNAKIMEIQTENVTVLGDFQLGGNLSWCPGAGSREVSGRWLYKNPVQLIKLCSSSPTVASFNAMFQVTIFSTPDADYQNICTEIVEGLNSRLSFIVVSDNSAQAEARGVKINFFQDGLFHDPGYAHLGVEIYSTNVNTSSITWLSTDRLVEGFQQDANVGLTIWIEYDGPTHNLEVFVTGSGDPSCDTRFFNPGLSCKPPIPILSMNVDMSDTFSAEGMYVGFSGSISNDLNRSYGIGYLLRGWTFNSDGPAPDYLRDADGAWLDESRKRRRKRNWIVIAIVLPVVSVFVLLVIIIFALYRKNARLTKIATEYQIEKGTLNGGPQNFKYKVLSTATKGFSSNELLGSGGFGMVYRGSLVLKGDKMPTKIAVKRISSTSHQGVQEFLAEVKIIGQAQHRNLVKLLGWCHERSELLLVYDYMPNGSVDHHLYKDSNGTPGELVLTWSRRLKIVSGVATALAYLHEEWEQRVIHRDVKSSNVLLDGDFNARLGDFGLARMSEHDRAPPSTAALAGTYGYMAPELVQTLKATEKTDVYSFGALVLEVATGKRPILSEEDRRTCDKILLVDWVWDLYAIDGLREAADRRLQNAYDQAEMLTFLKIGLLCSHPDPHERPKMRDVINIWKGSILFPALPRSKPVPIYPFSTIGWGSDTEGDAGPTVMTFGENHGQVDVSIAESSLLGSDGHSAITITSIDAGHSLPGEKLRGRKCSSPYPTLRHRPLPL